MTQLLAGSKKVKWTVSNIHVVPLAPLLEPHRLWKSRKWLLNSNHSSWQGRCHHGCTARHKCRMRIFGRGTQADMMNEAKDSCCGITSSFITRISISWNHLWHGWTVLCFKLFVGTLFCLHTLHFNWSNGWGWWWWWWWGSVMSPNFRVMDVRGYELITSWHQLSVLIPRFDYVYFFATKNSLTDFRMKRVPKRSLKNKVRKIVSTSWQFDLTVKPLQYSWCYEYVFNNCLLFTVSKKNGYKTLTIDYCNISYHD